MKGENIIGSGAKRMKHGAYKVCYRCLRYQGCYMYRAEIQTITAGGAFRKRKWFKTYDEGIRWLNGNKIF